MRTQKLLLPLSLLLASSLGACKWTEFDDLKDDTWVGSTEKPSVKSADYGVAIQRGQRAGDGATLVVLGAGQATYSELIYNAKGDSSLAPTVLELNSQYGIGTLDPQPIMIADPTSDDIAAVINAGGSQIAVLIGSGQIDLHQLFIAPSTVEAATYMHPPNRPDNGEPQMEAPLVASGDYVLGTFLANVPNPAPKCKLLSDKHDSGGVAIGPRALGVVASATPPFDDVLAWGASGKLFKYDGHVFNGCDPPPNGASPGEPLASIDTGFAPGHGSQILTLTGNLVVLQGHHDSDDLSFLQVYDASTMTAVGSPVTIAKLRAAAILTRGAAKYVIAGYPTAVVDGKSAGQVMLFTASATGLGATPAMTINDAQPDDNQSFGRSVTALPFNGSEVIAVAADNEVFVYFRAKLTDGTMLYEETRQGR